jgi:hypothetical protein
MRHEDRYLKIQDGRYYYQRRVPDRTAGLDVRAPLICKSLRTNDLAVARIRRDIHERVDELYWSELILHGESAINLARANVVAAALLVKNRPIDDLLKALGVTSAPIGNEG